MSKYIAFSSWAKENELSIPKDFDIEKNLLPKIPTTDYKIAGYRFNKDFLDSIKDEIVNDFNLKKIEKRELPKKIIILFKIKKDTIIYMETRENNIQFEKANLQTLLNLENLDEIKRLDYDNRILSSLSLFSKEESNLELSKKSKAVIFIVNECLIKLISDL